MSDMLRPPSLGPLVGHTTPTSVRIWMRGAEKSDMRTVGIAALYDIKGDKEIYVAKSAQYIRLHREHDRTGVVDFENLKPDTSYKVRVGSIALDSVDDAEEVDNEELWKKLPKPEAWVKDLDGLTFTENAAGFTTFPNTAGTDLSFVFGSCRYPGLVGASKKADSIFGSIHDQISKPGLARPRFVLMIGDQIYADKLNSAIAIGRADTPSEFHERYVEAFGSPNMRKLLRSTPTYMMLDDHEIEDNWIQTRIKDSKKRSLFQTAIAAYMGYQWLHSPRNYDQWGETNKCNGRMLYYSFECGGYPFFVMDSRTQRMRDDDDGNLDDNHLLGHPAKATAPGYVGQIDLLCAWLAEQQKKHKDRPKFIVSPSVFVPNDVITAGPGEKAHRHKCESDSWPAFPETRRQLLRAIVENKVQNVVFLSGDVHCSNVAEISFFDKNNGELPLRALSITSSAFYWPWTFADGDPLGFVHDSDQEADNFDVTPDIEMRYRAFNFEQEDNFTQIEVSANNVVATNFGRTGNKLRSTKLKLA